MRSCDVSAARGGFEAGLFKNSFNFVNITPQSSLLFIKTGQKQEENQPFSHLFWAVMTPFLKAMEAQGSPQGRALTLLGCWNSAGRNINITRSWMLREQECQAIGNADLFCFYRLNSLECIPALPAL